VAPGRVREAPNKTHLHFYTEQQFGHVSPVC
jgi:hypothetical protein